MTNWDLSQISSVRYLEINYCNLSHQQAQKEKWYDPVRIRCRKGHSDKIQHPLR